MSGIWLRRVSDNKRMAEGVGCLYTSESAKTRIAIMRRQEWWVWEFEEGFEEWLENLSEHLEYLPYGVDYMWRTTRCWKYTDSEGNQQEMKFLIVTERR